MRQSMGQKMNRFPKTKIRAEIIQVSKSQRPSLRKFKTITNFRSLMRQTRPMLRCSIKFRVESAKNAKFVKKLAQRLLIPLKEEYRLQIPPKIVIQNLSTPFFKRYRKLVMCFQIIRLWILSYLRYMLGFKPKFPFKNLKIKRHCKGWRSFR